jgi:hypothetical protein
MQRRNRNASTLGEQAILGDEQAAALRTEVAELSETVAEIGRRVHAQFTTIAAHAEIARQQIEHVRDEAHSDIDRTRELLITLIEQIRCEANHPSRYHAAGTAPGPSVTAYGERLMAVESRVNDTLSALDNCFNRQRVLADTMEALIDTVMAERRGEPVAGLALT